jgi:hypothetical protein
MLPFYYEDEDDAIDFIEKLVDDLPGIYFSDRLVKGDMKEVSRIIRDAVHQVYGGNGGQARVAESDSKLALTKKAWDRGGFSLIDRSTWKRTPSSLGRYFNFTSAVHIKAIAYLAGILKTDIETCADVTRQILRIAHQERYLPVAYFAAVLKSFDICVRHDGRVNEYINALAKMRWLVKLSESSADDHRARAYATGDEFSALVGEREESDCLSTTNTHNAYEPMLSVPLFLRDSDLEAAMGWKTPHSSNEEQERPPHWAISEPFACSV